MYTPKHFAEQDTQKLFDFIRAHPLATFITDKNGAPEANHIPMHIEERDGDFFLAGHVARNNSLWSEHDVTKEILAIFHGENTYISPSLYATKAETGKVVPTWNYVAVHVRGTINFIQDGEWLVSHLTKITDQQEKLLEHPWKLSDAPDEYIQRMTQAVVGFEIHIKDINGKWKVSQNRNAQDRASVIDALSQTGHANMAELIAQYSPD